MPVELLAAFETAVAAEAEAKRKLEQAKKDLAFHVRKVPRMEDAYTAASKALAAARAALPAAPAKK